MPKGLFIKRNVPTGSTLEVRISPNAPPPAPDQWNATLVLRRRDGQQELFRSNAQLRAGVSHILSTAASDRFDGPLVLTFAGPSEARVQIRIVKPSGQQHGGAYNEIHSSAPADAVALVIFMG